MRAYDLAVFLAVFGAVIGVLDASAVWGEGTVETGDEILTSNDFDMLEDIDGTTLSPLVVGADPPTTFGTWAILVGAIKGIFNVYTIIAEAFGNTDAAKSVASVIQGGIYIIYASAIYQLWSGKQIKGME